MVKIGGDDGEMVFMRALELELENGSGTIKQAS